MAAPTSPPVGVVAMLFTDVEGSTALARLLGDRWAAVQGRHHAIIGAAIRDQGGWVDGTEGDAFFATFAAAAQAVRAAVEAQRRLRAEPWPPGAGEVRVRMAVHVGSVQRTETGYVGLDIHLAARVAAAAHGGQVLLTQPAVEADGDVVPVDDLGLHRLRDFPRPEHLYCLVVDGRGARAFPPPRTLDVRPTNLPPPGRLVGREEDLKALVDALTDGRTRLLTITGPGGCGKTSMALAVGQELLDGFRGGVWWVPLAARVRASEVLPAVAAAVHADPAGRMSVPEALTARFEAASTLLVLDNMEHLLGAAADVVDLLGRVPTLRVLVTAQTPLHVPSEQVHPLRVLDDGSATQLFVECGRRARPGLDIDADELVTVGDVCGRLGRLPLAIELAAARLSVLELEELASRLGESFALVSGTRRGDLPRHESLAATIDWTLSNLDAESRTLFAGLGAFARPASLTAIEAVAAGCVTNVVDRMGVLLDFALVERLDEGDGVARFGMPEALRQAAEAGLDQRSDAEPWRRRHAEYVGQVLDAGSWLIMATAATHREAVRLAPDAARALGWARRHDRPLAAAIAASWSLILADEGRLRESRPLSRSVVEDEAAPPTARAQALFAEGITAMNEGRLDAALAYGEQALELAERSDPGRYVEFLALLAGLRGFMGDTDRAVADVTTAERSASAMGEAAHAGVLFFEAQVRLFADDPDGAAAAHRRTVEIGRRSDAWPLAIIDTQRGDLALAYGDFAAALAWYLRSLDFAMLRQDEGQVFFDLCSIVACLVGLEQYQGAAEVAGIVRAHAAQVYGTADFADRTLERYGTLAELADALSPDALESADRAGRDVEPGLRTRRAHELSRRPQTALG